MSGEVVSALWRRWCDAAYGEARADLRLRQDQGVQSASQVRLGERRRRRGWGCRPPIGEGLSDLGLQARKVGNVADHHQHGALGPVPAAIEALEVGAADRLDRRQRADRRALGGEQFGRVEVRHRVRRQRLGVSSRAALGQDDVALSIHHGRIELDAVGDVTKPTNGQPPFPGAAARQVDQVQGRVDRGEGVLIAAEADADRGEGSVRARLPGTCGWRGRPCARRSEPHPVRNRPRPGCRYRRQGGRRARPARSGWA